MQVHKLYFVTYVFVWFCHTFYVKMPSNIKTSMVWGNFDLQKKDEANVVIVLNYYYVKAVPQMD